MLHHVSVGVRDVERAAQFYDPVLKTLGYRRVMEFLPYAIGYGETRQRPEFWIQLPQNRQPATTGNGVHVAFLARNRKVIDGFHSAALSAGGSNGGEPGPRLRVWLRRWRPAGAPRWWPPAGGRQARSTTG